MPLKNTSTHYGRVAKWLHWLIAIAVIGMLCLGPFMGDIPDKALRGQVYMLHKFAGISILLLMLVRIMWAVVNIKPALPVNTPAWEKTAERVVHFMFYLLLIAMPLSGWVMATAAGKPPSFFNLFALPLVGIPADKPLAHFASSLHTELAITLAILLTVHIGAALKHHWINKDNILKRMT